MAPGTTRAPDKSLSGALTAIPAAKALEPLRTPE